MGRGTSTSRIHAFYDVHAEPDRYLGVDDTHVVVVGRYRGKARADDCEVDAAFAHIITTRGDRVAELQQITDTRRWAVAMPEEADTRNSAN
jgi:ketosteroid isomerase-like protein